MSFFLSEFTARSAANRTRFKPGVRRELAQEIDLAGARRALLLTTPEQAALAGELAAICGDRIAGRFAGAVMHTPVEVSERAAAHAREIGADLLVAAGGGSTIGLAKAVALRTGLPQIAIPTTYAGSEATPILGQTENGMKTTLTDARVQPDVILYDAELVATLPPGMTVTSGLNAMAHAVEGLYARDRSPISTMMALEGVRAFHEGLPRVMQAPGDLQARGLTLYGAWLCGTVLGQVGMALHHKLCHTLGGTFGLPHAETHAVILPHAIAYNEAAVPDLLVPVARIFGTDSAAAGIHDLAARLGAPLALRDLGLAQSDLDRAADLAAANPYWNPREIRRDPLRRLLQAAWNGDAPQIPNHCQEEE